MPRLPRAADVLIAQVQEQYKSAKATPVGDPDGLDVYRTIEFTKAPSKWLTPILEAINDPRIASLETEKDSLRVTFSPKSVADRKHPFPLAEVDTILNK